MAQGERDLPLEDGGGRALRDLAEASEGVVKCNASLRGQGRHPGQEVAVGAREESVIEERCEAAPQGFREPGGVAARLVEGVDRALDGLALPLPQGVGGVGGLERLALGARGLGEALQLLLKERRLRGGWPRRGGGAPARRRSR